MNVQQLYRMLLEDVQVYVEYVIQFQFENEGNISLFSTLSIDKNKGLSDRGVCLNNFDSSFLWVRCLGATKQMTIVHQYLSWPSYCPLTYEWHAAPNCRLYPHVQTHTHKCSKGTAGQKRRTPRDSSLWGSLTSRVCVCDCPFRDMPPMSHRNLLITATELEVICHSADLEIKMTI